MIYKGLAPANNNSSGSGDTVDMTSASGDCICHQSIGFVSGSGATFASKIQESDNGSSWSDVSGGAFTNVTASNNFQSISFTRTKRYVRHSRTVTGVSTNFYSSVFFDEVPATPVTVEVDVVDLAITANSPAAKGAAKTTVAPVALLIVPSSPTARGNARATPATVDLAITPHSPSVSIRSVVTVSLVNMIIEPYSPIASGKALASPAAAGLAISPYNPAILGGARVAVSLVNLPIVPSSPTARGNAAARPATALMAVQAFTPSVKAGARVAAPLASMAITIGNAKAKPQYPLPAGVWHYTLGSNIWRS